MKTLMKKIISVVITAAVATSLAISASAAHTTSAGLPCNNTFYTLKHYTQTGSYTGIHAYTCTVTYYAYRHAKTCTSCNTNLGEVGAYTCTESHTCGNYIRNCTGVFGG